MPAASTSAVACAARPRAFQGAWRACARNSATGALSDMIGNTNADSASRIGKRALVRRVRTTRPGGAFAPPGRLNELARYFLPAGFFAAFFGAAFFAGAFFFT